MKEELRDLQKKIEDLRKSVYAGNSAEETEKELYEIGQIVSKLQDLETEQRSKQ